MDAVAQFPWRHSLDPNPGVNDCSPVATSLEHLAFEPGNLHYPVAQLGWGLGAWSGDEDIPTHSLTELLGPESVRVGGRADAPHFQVIGTVEGASPVRRPVDRLPGFIQPDQRGDGEFQFGHLSPA